MSIDQLFHHHVVNSNERNISNKRLSRKKSIVFKAKLQRLSSSDELNVKKLIGSKDIPIFNLPEKFKINAKKFFPILNIDIIVKNDVLEFLEEKEFIINEFTSFYDKTVNIFDNFINPKYGEILISAKFQSNYFL